MKRVFLATLMLAAAFAPAHAQGLNIGATDGANDPLTGLPPADWIKLATNLVNGKSVVGKPLIFMVNATGKELSTVTCDGKWTLVGPKPYDPEGAQGLPRQVTQGQPADPDYLHRDRV
jgi:hypothetical protein